MLVLVFVRGILVENVLLHIYLLLLDVRLDAEILVVLLLLDVVRLDAGNLLLFVLVVRFLLVDVVPIEVVVRSVNVQLHLVCVVFLRLHNILLLLVEEQVVIHGFFPFLFFHFVFKFGFLMNCGLLYL